MPLPLATAPTGSAAGQKSEIKYKNSACSFLPAFSSFWLCDDPCDSSYLIRIGQKVGEAEAGERAERGRGGALYPRTSRQGGLVQLTLASTGCTQPRWFKHCPPPVCTPFRATLHFPNPQFAKWVALLERLAITCARTCRPPVVSHEPCSLPFERGFGSVSEGSGVRGTALKGAPASQPVGNRPGLSRTEPHSLKI